MEQVEDAVQPLEVVAARNRLQAGPAEDPDADEVDAGLAHQPDVLLPDDVGPLVGVVVAAVQDVRQPRAQQRADALAQPFVAPSVSPRTKCFWSSTKTMMGGIAASIEPAASRL